MENKLIAILENFAVFLTLGILQFGIFGVISPIAVLVLILASWLPYLGVRAYFEEKNI